MITTMKRKNKPGAGRPSSEWTAEKINLLKKHYPNKSNEEAAKMLGITVSSLRNAAVRFNVKKNNRFWDKPEEAYILKNWPHLSVIELIEGLKNKFGVDKTKWAVINKYRELINKGLKENKK